MSEELKVSLARIACLEGEIAKRDARIVELHADLSGCRERAGVDADKLRSLRAELAAIKAQEPVQVDYVAVMRADGDGGLEVEWLLEGGTDELMNGMYLCCVGGGTLLFEEGNGQLCAAPVSEVKAHGVVMPEPLMAAITRADDVLHAISNWESSSVKLEQRHGPEWTKEVDAIRRELHTQLARLNSIEYSACVSDGLSVGMNQDEAEEFAARLNASPVSAELKELQRKSDLFDAYAAEAEKLGFSGICELIDAALSAVCAAAPNIAPTSEHSGS